MRWKTLALLLPALLGSALGAADLSDIRAMIDEGRATEALSSLDEYLKGSPTDPEALFMRGLVLAQTRQEDQAIELFQETSGLRPDRPEPLNNLAVIQASRGDYEAAVETLKEALRTHPAYRTAYENLTKIYGQLASEAYSRALTVDQTRNRSSVELVLLSEMVLPEIRIEASPEPEVEVAESQLESPAEPLPVDVTESLRAEIAEPLAENGDRDEPMGTDAVDSEPMTGESMAEAEVAVAEASEEIAEPMDSDSMAASKGEERSTPEEPVSSPEEAIAEALEVGTDGRTEPAGSQVEPGELADLVEAWALAWSEQRVDDYLYFYGRDFSPSGEISRDDWEDLRRKRVAVPEFIKVSVAFLDFDGVPPDRARVRFNQSYDSNTFSDVVTKTLVLAREDGVWKIVSETVDS
ncbi:MAG: tetratricopeptide repeat protein [Thermoanaerobaculia bacterium]